MLLEIKFDESRFDENLGFVRVHFPRVAQVNYDTKTATFHISTFDQEQEDWLRYASTEYNYILSYSVVPQAQSTQTKQRVKMEVFSGIAINDAVRLVYTVKANVDRFLRLEGLVDLSRIQITPQMTATTREEGDIEYCYTVAVLYVGQETQTQSAYEASLTGLDEHPF